MRTLLVESDVFADLSLDAVRLEGVEAVNDLATYQIQLKWEADPEGDEESLDVLAWLGHTVKIQIEQGGRTIEDHSLLSLVVSEEDTVIGGGNRWIHGVIEQAQFLDDEGRYRLLSIRVAARLSMARLTSNYRIYQNMNVCDLLKKLLEPYEEVIHWRLQNYSAKEQYPVREIFVQYNESDWDFFRRICSEWGINFWWEHDESNAYLILANCADAHPFSTCKSYQTIPFLDSDQKSDEEHLYQFYLTSQTVPGAVFGYDYNYTSPNETIIYHKENTTPYTPEGGEGDYLGAQQKYQKYIYPSAQVQVRAGASFERNDWRAEERYRAQWNLEREQQHQFQASAEGNLRGLSVGQRFRLQDHPAQSANIDWVIRSLHILMVEVDGESRRLKDDHPGWTIQTTMTCNPWKLPIRPEFIAKPIASLSTATVVGDEKSNVYTDIYGRIKVQFHWDRYGKNNPDSSCWVRVHQPWAGNQMGGIFIPRVQQEVLIDFIHQDPDRPVCIGKLGNENNLPNWKLTENQSLSGFVSREFGEKQAGNQAGGRSNYLVFDDTKGRIQTQMGSDYEQSVLSLGAIHRVSPGKGRQESRGQGFELRTDAYGSLRAGGGIYISSYRQDMTQGRMMAAMESQLLLDESLRLVEHLSDNAHKRQADPLTPHDSVKKFRSAINSGLINLQISSAQNKVMNQLTQKLGIDMNHYIQLHKGKLEKAAKAILVGSLLSQLAKVVLSLPKKPHIPAALIEDAEMAETLYENSEYAHLLDKYEQEMDIYKKNLPGKAKGIIDQLKRVPHKKHNAFLSNPSFATLLSEYVAPVQSIIDNIWETHLSNSLFPGKKNAEDIEEKAEKLIRDFRDNVVLVSGQGGIGLMTPRVLQSYAWQQHNMSTAGDMNITAGQSWFASIGQKLSFFVHKGLKLFSAHGKVELQAQDGEMELHSKKAMSIISTKDKVQIVADTELVLACGGAYIRIKNGNIDIHAPGTIDFKASSHAFSGSTKMDVEKPDLPDAECKECTMGPDHQKKKPAKKAKEPAAST